MADNHAEDELFEWAIEQSPPAQKKTTVVDCLVEEECIERANEQALFLIFPNPRKPDVAKSQWVHV